jgi:hypothetical protein
MDLGCKDEDCGSEDGYDSIVLMAPKAFAKFKESGKVPRKLGAFFSGPGIGVAQPSYLG